MACSCITSANSIFGPDPVCFCCCCQSQNLTQLNLKQLRLRLDISKHLEHTHIPHLISSVVILAQLVSPSVALPAELVIYCLYIMLGNTCVCSSLQTVRSNINLVPFWTPWRPFYIFDKKTCSPGATPNCLEHPTTCLIQNSQRFLKS